MKSLVTARIRKRFAKRLCDRCEHVSGTDSLSLRCLLSKDHRGLHASELTLAGGGVQALWPVKRKTGP